MNVKVANLVAVQFGVLLGIASWLAYSRFESAEPRIAVEMRRSPAAPVAAVAPISDLGSQVTRVLENGVDREQDQSIAEQPAPAVHQYSAAAVQQYSALAAQQYYQQIAPRRYASSGLENSSVAADTPSYAEVAQEPAVSSDYVEPLQPVAYAEPAQVVAVYQPQFIVFSNQRRFANRCRPTLRPAAVTPITHRGPGRGGPHQNVCATPRKNPDVQSCRPGKESRGRGKR